MLEGFPVSSDAFGISKDVFLYCFWVLCDLEFEALDWILRLHNVRMRFRSDLGDLRSVLMCSRRNGVIWFTFHSWPPPKCLVETYYRYPFQSTLKIIISGEYILEFDLMFSSVPFFVEDMRD